MELMDAEEELWGESAVARADPPAAGVAWGRPFDPNGKIEISYRHRVQLSSNDFSK